jgi:hypothetical protein
MPEQEELFVDLPDSGPHVEVNIDSSEPVRVSENSEVEVSREDDGEHAEYSKKVQRRIDKLTKKAREAERQQEAALTYARTMQHENVALKGKVQSLDEGYVAEYGDRIATETQSIARDLEDAIATNDTSSQVELNKKMAQLAIEEERVRAAQLQQKASYNNAPPAPQMAPPPSKPDPKAEDWATRNDWFGDDEAMTFAAFGIHKKLVEEEAFDTDSPEYYDEIDKRMREAFPHKFNGEVTVSDSRKPQQAVASATRSSSSGRKTVRLSSSEVAIANKLGVPLDEYAKYKR